MAALLQHGPGFHLHFLFCQWSRYIHQCRSCLVWMHFNTFDLWLWLSAGATAPLAGELFTQQFKSAAYIIACTINWFCLFVLGMVFPIIVVRVQVQAGLFSKLHHSCSDCPLFSAEASACLLLPHISVFLHQLWAVHQVQRSRNQESNSAADRCRVSEDAHKRIQKQEAKRDRNTWDQTLNI